MAVARWRSARSNSAKQTSDTFAPWNIPSPRLERARRWANNPRAVRSPMGVPAAFHPQQNRWSWQPGLKNLECRFIILLENVPRGESNKLSQDCADSMLRCVKKPYGLQSKLECKDNSFLRLLFFFLLSQSFFVRRVWQFQRSPENIHRAILTNWSLLWRAQLVPPLPLPQPSQPGVI